MAYAKLVGKLLTRNGIRYMIVKHDGATVVATCREGRGLRRVIVPLADALKYIDADEIELTPVPEDAG